MTAEPDLLPLPEGGLAGEMRWGAQVYGRDEMHAYARACVAHATAAKDAEIEALRAEVERVTCELMDATTRADKLEEAIKAYKSECDNPAKDYVLRAKRRDEMFALLRDQEEGNGQ